MYRGQYKAMGSMIHREHRARSRGIARDVLDGAHRGRFTNRPYMPAMHCGRRCPNGANQCRRRDDASIGNDYRRM
jgi:hypothetical protein